MAGKLSLYELQLIIRDSLYMALPDMYWVVAEISELKENYAGHCYLELIEKQPDEKNIKARVRAVMWCKRYNFLKSFFENSTGETLREGIKVLVKAKVEYHELYGLSLVICDIDPAFTVGDMAVKRLQIIRRLEQEGVFTMNKDLELPLCIQRIAVISSAGAAGYTDFMNHLTLNSSGYVFYTKLFESAMQGADTEEGITGALDRIAAHAGMFDVVAIIRGGGSQLDLSWFDNYSIAYHVTQFPLPVLTGIGHDKDLSVTDMVANTSLKTPTALAGFILDHVAAVEARLTDSGNALKEKSRLIIERKKNRIETFGLKLLPLSKMLISRISELLARAETALRNDSRNIIRLRKSEIENFQRALVILNPDNVLSRGYTMTMKNGRIIKKSLELKGGDLIDTKFSDGSITSRVFSNLNPVRKESELND
jgi:exodeoxyribonuclease VII large subunit